MNKTSYGSLFTTTLALRELAQIVQALGLSDGARMEWSAVEHTELASRMLATSRELGFIG